MQATQLNLFAPRRIIPDFGSYDRIVVAFSGGKDSVCCVLHLLDMNINPAKIELHHHLVDGREGSDLFDWPCTEDYCRKFAQAFGLRLYFSWLEGGLEREMCRANQAKAPTHFETPEGVQAIGGQGQPGTRRKFPAKTADLSRRWCSAYAKIDVLSASHCQSATDSITAILSSSPENVPRRVAPGQSISSSSHTVVIAAAVPSWSVTSTIGDLFTT